MTATLYRRGALADGTSERLRHDVSLLAVDGRIAWIRPADDEGPLPTGDPPVVVDAHGSTMVPGLVDGHAHVTLPGGASWIARIDDPVEDLLAAAEHNARLLGRAGVRWIRDVGSPRVARTGAAGERALALDVRDRWRGRRDVPYIRAAGTWLMQPGTLPTTRVVVAESGEALLAAAAVQLADGADLLKLYLDGRVPGEPPWPLAAVERVVALAHARGARVTAHSGSLEGARLGVEAGIDAIEHGFVLDAAVAAEMARRGTFLVSTLTVFRSWVSYAATTPAPAVHRATRRGPGSRPGASGPTRACGLPGPPACPSRRAPTSAAARRGRTSSPGRSRPSSAPASSRGRRWRRRPGAAASSSASRRRGGSGRAGRPTSSSSTATR